MKQKLDNETNPRTPSILLEALEKWHEDGQFQDIIDAIRSPAQGAADTGINQPAGARFTITWGRTRGQASV